VLPKMKLVPILILWLVSLYQTVGPGQTHSGVFGGGPVADAVSTSLVIQRGPTNSIPGDPGSGSLGASLEDEEDSLEDGLFCTSLAAFWRSPTAGTDNLSCRADSQLGLLRIPSRPHPLRC
jgi:hypothetical protein